MAEEKVSILFQIKDAATAAIRKIQSGLSDFGRSANIAKHNAEQLKDKLEGLGSIGRTVAVGAGLITAALGGIAYASLKAAGDFEQQRIAFETLLGDAGKAKTLLKDIEKFAAATPFELPGLVTGAQRLIAFGTGAEHVVDTLRMLGDASMGNAETLERLVDAYGKTQSKGKATMEELNRFTEAGVPIMAQLAKNTGKTTGEVYKMVEQGKIGFSDVKDALIDLTSEGGKFYKMTEKQSQSFVGLFSTMKDSVGALARSFGEQLLPSAKSVTTGITSFIEKLNNISPTAKTIIAVIGAAVFVVGSLATAFGAFLAIIPSIVTGMTLLKISAAGLASATGIGLLITVMSTLGYVVYNNWNSIRGVISGVSASILESILGLVKGVDSLIEKFNTLAKKVPGIPVINLGTEKAISGLESLITKLRETERLSKKKVGSSTGTSQSDGGLSKGIDKGGDDGNATVAKTKSRLDELMSAYNYHFAELRSLRDVNTSEELLAMQKIAADSLLTAEERKRAEIDVFQLRERQRRDTTEREAALGRSFVDSIGALGDQQLSIAEQVSKGTFGFIKGSLLAQVDAWAAAEATKASISAWAMAGPTFGGSLVVLAGQLTAISAAVIGARATIGAIKLASGGIVMPSPGGTQATIGEGGSAEAVIPLDSKNGREALGGGGGETRVILLDSDGVTTLARGIFARADYLQSTGQMARSR